MFKGGRQKSPGAGEGGGGIKEPRCQVAAGVVSGWLHGGGLGLRSRAPPHSSPAPPPGGGGREPVPRPQAGERFVRRYIVQKRRSALRPTVFAGIEGWKMAPHPIAASLMHFRALRLRG